MSNNYNNNSNIISNPTNNRNVSQTHNNNSKEESSEFLFNQLMTGLQELTKEVKELKEQIKNTNS